MPTQTPAFRAVLAGEIRAQVTRQGMQLAPLSDRTGISVPGLSQRLNAHHGLNFDDLTRGAATMAAAAAGSNSMTGTAGPWTNVSTTETITHISAWTAPSAGPFNRSGALTASQAWGNRNKLALNTLTVSLTPMAT